MYRCASFFAGVGGIDLGFSSSKFETVYANEFDNKAADTFELNFPKIKVDRRDIHDVDSSEIPDFDILLAGFPCQAFSIAGYRQGFDDFKGRGDLFFELTRIIEEKKPSVVFLENVKNLVGHDNGNTFKVIIEQLEKLGYENKIDYAVMNAMHYGNIPQNRERIYIVAFRDKEAYQRFHMPKPILLNRKITDVIDFNSKVDSKYYYTKKNCVFYDKLKNEMKRTDTVYQWRRIYVRENKSYVCPTLTANMGMGGHNVPLILTNDGKIRKLTPKECFSIQGFPSEFKLPKDTAMTHLYKQAGNSVVVEVIKRISGNIEEVLSTSSDDYINAKLALICN